MRTPVSISVTTNNSTGWRMACEVVTIIASDGTMWIGRVNNGEMADPWIQLPSLPAPANE